MLTTLFSIVEVLAYIQNLQQHMDPNILKLFRVYVLAYGLKNDSLIIVLKNDNIVHLTCINF